MVFVVAKNFAGQLSVQKMKKTASISQVVHVFLFFTIFCTSEVSFQPFNGDICGQFSEI